MHKTVSVKKAIKRGHWMISYPVFTILFSTSIPAIYLGVQKIIPPWIMLTSIGVGIVSAWFYAKIMATKWKLWAFKNVRNVHELKKRATQEHLLAKGNNFLDRIELISARDKERWNTLQEKFAGKDLFENDFTVANETIIYYSKWKNYAQMLIPLGGLVLGLILVIEGEHYIAGAILAAFGAYFSYSEYKEATNTKPQIILNDKGIKTSSLKFYSWSEVKNEEAIVEEEGKHTNYYLVYDHPNGSAKIDIEDFDIDYEKLHQLLILYRGRSNANHRPPKK